MGYSADVRLSLFKDGKRHEVAQVSESFIHLRDCVFVSNGTAVMTVTVDGISTDSDVLIQGGGVEHNATVLFCRRC